LKRLKILPHFRCGFGVFRNTTAASGNQTKIWFRDSAFFLIVVGSSDSHDFVSRLSSKPPALGKIICSPLVVVGPDIVLLQALLLLSGVWFLGGKLLCSEDLPDSPVMARDVPPQIRCRRRVC